MNGFSSSAYHAEYPNVMIFQAFIIFIVEQGCLLPYILFSIFLKRFMPDSLEEHDGKVSIELLPICGLSMKLMLLWKKGSTCN